MSLELVHNFQQNTNQWPSCFMPVDNSYKFVVYLKSIYHCHKEETMKNLSLKLDDDIFQETEKIVARKVD